ncbi:MAG: hypothetical protein KBF51_12855 [Chitinophagales bacterium]|nr:hypothetical protein [Chitinophagales bacterium]MBP9190418.1 hypothetical protein [Chitinophagales bacterium]MBP9548603.1 hypothetical protein [Chitinophagales bacterium]MBP9705006.1 hypothetical protein [Chitinophagales bacterium]
MPYQNSLAFNSVNEIKFSVVNSQIEIRVNTILLGTINSGYPVSIYITNNSAGQNFITLIEISEQEYTSGNNNEPNRTIHFNHLANVAKLKIKKCSNQENYKIIGWEDEELGGLCMHGIIKYFDISTIHHFKAKIETVNSNLVMVIKYDHDVLQLSEPDPVCSQILFSYSCSP